MRICSNHYTDVLRKNFSANPLRIPQEAYQPMTLLAIRGKKPTILGTFEDLLSGTLTQIIPIKKTAVAEFTGEQTSRVKWNIGLKILSNFITAFGVDPAKIGTGFEGTNKITFSFEDIMCHSISQLQLDRAVVSEDLRAELNSGIVNRVISDKNERFALITDVFISNNFKVSCFKNNHAKFDLDIPLLESIVSDTDVDITVDSDHANTVRFNSTKHLTFAFTCSELEIDSTSGKILFQREVTNLKPKAYKTRSELEEDIPYERLLLDGNIDEPLLI